MGPGVLLGDRRPGLTGSYYYALTVRMAPYAGAVSTCRFVSGRQDKHTSGTLRDSLGDRERETDYATLQF